MLSERGSLVLPIDASVPDRLTPAAAGLPAELSLGRLRLRRKAEHHLTVVNQALGHALAGVIALRPALLDEINAIAAAHPFAIALRAEFFHLAQIVDGEPPLHTIVALASADLAGFYRKLSQVVVAQGLAEAGPLLEALAFPPPPHVTLYTSDLEGREGIGLNRMAELMDALAFEGGSGLRAFPLHPDVILGD